MATEKKVVTVNLPVELIERMDTYLKSSVSVVNSKRALIEKSITDFLDREEIVAVKMEKELTRIREKLR